MSALLPLAVAVPLLTAALIVALSPAIGRGVADAISLAAAAALAVFGILLLVQASGGLVIHWFGGWRPQGGVALGIAFAADQVSAALTALTGLLTAAAFVFSWHYFDSVGILFHALMLVFAGSMAGFALSGDLFTMFVFFELMSVTAYALTGYKTEESSLEGAFNFAVLNSLGAFLVLLGIGLLYGRTGALNLAQIGRAIGAAPADGLVVAAFVLVSCGFLVKGAIVPFHSWLADAHAVAPTPVCMLFSGIMVELGVYGLVRVFWTVFSGPLGPFGASIRGLWLTVGAVTAVVGAALCFLQRHLKRLLAFSSISHMGILMIGAAFLNPVGMAGMVVYLVAHGLAKGGLFAGAGILLHRYSSVDEIELQGKAVGHRVEVTLTFVLGGLALAGTPPSGLFLGKALIEEAERGTGFRWVLLVLLVASALTGGAVLRAAGRIFLGWKIPLRTVTQSPTEAERRETRGALRKAPALMTVPAFVLVLMAFFAGLVPGLRDRATGAATAFRNRDAYAAAVLDGAPGPRPSPERTEKTGGSWIFAAGSMGAAIALALVGLKSHGITPWVRKAAWAVGRPAIGALRRWDSRRVEDYVAWLVAGVALWAIWLTITVR